METEVITKLTQLMSDIEKTLGSIVDRSNEMNDSSKDRDIASNLEKDRGVDQSTTDYTQDVDTQERIRSTAVTYDNSKGSADLENQRRDRAQYDRMQSSSQSALSILEQGAVAHFNNVLNLNTQVLANLTNAAEMSRNQDRRHVDHTLIDMHGSDVNPGAAPNAQPTQDGTK